MALLPIQLNGATRMNGGDDGRTPLWYRALDRFGVPTVVLCLVMAAFAYHYNAQREDFGKFVIAYTASMDKQTETLSVLAKEVKRLSDIQEQTALWKQFTSGNQ